MDVRTYARIKNVIWDQLLATKAAKLSRLKLYFRFACKMELLFQFTFEENIFDVLKKVLRLASPMKCADSDK